METPNEKVKEQAIDMDELAQLSPAIMIRELYAEKYGEPMSDELAKKVAEVKRSCEETEV